MAARGFVMRQDQAASRVMSGEYAIHMSLSENWSWDLGRFVPRLD